MVLSAVDDKKTHNYTFCFALASLAGLVIWSAHDITSVPDFAPKELDGTPMMQSTSLSKTNEMHPAQKVCSCKRAKSAFAGMCYTITEKMAGDAAPENMMDCDTRKCVPEYECVKGYDTGTKCVQRRVAVGVQPIGYGKCVQMKRYEDIYVPISST